MGVLGWTPDALRAASLEDMADAWRGFAALKNSGGFAALKNSGGFAALKSSGGFASLRGLLPQEGAVSRMFLEEMMQRFPDERKRA